MTVSGRRRAAGTRRTGPRHLGTTSRVTPHKERRETSEGHRPSVTRPPTYTRGHPSPSGSRVDEWSVGTDPGGVDAYRQ